MKWLKFLLWSVVLLVIAAPFILVVTGESDPLSKDEISAHAKLLNEAAAVQIPHFFLMEDHARARHLALLEKVESGKPLNASESTIYRKVFQQVLFEGQGFLGRFDAELTVMHNVEMGRNNNTGSKGIEGHHDHHDVSARRNYADIEHALAKLDQASGVFGFLKRIQAINLAQKSLADVISHMGVAPHTVSIAYHNPEQIWREKTIGITFEGMMQAYKASQFDLVNSPAYWKNIDRAVSSYADLVEQVQTKLWIKSTWWERRIAGRFLDIQTLAPQIDANTPLRNR